MNQYRVRGLWEYWLAFQRAQTQLGGTAGALFPPRLEITVNLLVKKLLLEDCELRPVNVPRGDL